MQRNVEFVTERRRLQIVEHLAGHFGARGQGAGANSHWRHFPVAEEGTEPPAAAELDPREQQPAAQLLAAAQVRQAVGVRERGPQLVHGEQELRRRAREPRAVQSVAQLPQNLRGGGQRGKRRRARRLAARAAATGRRSERPEKGRAPPHQSGVGPFNRRQTLEYPRDLAHRPSHGSQPFDLLRQLLGLAHLRRKHIVAHRRKHSLLPCRGCSKTKKYERVSGSPRNTSALPSL